MSRPFLAPKTSSQFKFSWLVTSLLGFSAGIALAELTTLPLILVMGVGTVALVGLSWRRARLIALVLLCLSLGIWRWTNFVRAPVRDVSQLIGKNAVVTGEILHAPSTPDKQILTLEHLRLKDGEISGKLSVSTFPLPTYHVGQEVTVECIPQALSPSSRLRQWSHGIHARCFDAKVVRVAVAHPSVRIHLGKFESSLTEFFHRSFNEPQASLVAGIVLGDQNGMPASLTQAFQATGTTHIVALSGFNVTIIVSSMMVVLVRVVGRRWAWIPGLALVLIFIVMTGASASVVRAGIMAVISQFAMFTGRPVHPGRLLGYTALLMLWNNPLILIHDLGFQLSFLATIGLVFLSKPMTAKLSFIPDIFGVRENLGTTLAAIIATEPLLLWQFGRLSLVAPLVNIVVLPFVPIAMGLGTLCFAGMMLPAVTPAVTAVADAVLRLILGCITVAAGWSWSMVRTSTIVTAVSGTLLFMIAFWLIRHPHEDEAYPA